MATGDSLVAAGVPWVTAHDTARERVGEISRRKQLAHRYGLSGID